MASWQIVSSCRGSARRGPGLAGPPAEAALESTLAGGERRALERYEEGWPDESC